jgi:hypothetical protein
MTQSLDPAPFANSPVSSTPVFPSGALADRLSLASSRADNRLFVPLLTLLLSPPPELDSESPDLEMSSDRIGLA